MNKRNEESHVESLITSALEFIELLKTEKLPDIIVTQSTTGIFRLISSTLLAELERSSKLCKPNIGLNIKLNLCQVNYYLGSNQHFRPLSNAISFVF